MDQRTKLTLEILDKLGAPLLAAIVDLAARESAGKDGKAEVPVAREAELVAVLLARSVKVGLALSQALRLQDTDGEADAARLALTAVASQLVAGYYRQAGKPPGEAEIARMVTAFEAVLTFADNFSPAADTVLRLESLDPTVFLADENQILIQYVGVFIPVINAVAAYSFGRQEKKLVQEVAGRLVDIADSMRQDLVAGDIDAKQARKIDLQLLKSLVAIYVESHRREVARLMAMDEKERGDLSQSGGMSMDPVWQGFEARAAMLDVLGRNMAPGGARTGAGNGGGQGVAPPVAAQTSAVQGAQPSGEAQVPAAQPVSQPSAPPPAGSETTPEKAPAQPVQSEEPAAKEEGNYNPMSFFKKKDDE